MLSRPAYALSVLCEQSLDAIPRPLIDNRFMKAFMNLAFVGQPTEVERVRQDLVEMAPTDQSATCGLAVAVCPHGQPDIFLVEDGLEPHDGTDLEISPKEIPHEGGVVFDYVQRPVLDPVTERDDPPIHMPFFFEAVILSRIRSPVTSRSN